MNVFKSPAEFLSVGMQIASPNTQVHHHSEGETMKLFRAHFGTRPNVCAFLWNRIHNDPERNSRIPAGMQVKHILWAFLFLKVYGNEDVLCTLASRTQRRERKVDRKCFMSWVRCYIKEIALLLPTEIKWQNRLRFDNGSMAKISVDGTDYMVFNCPEGLHDWYYSHKFNGPALRYEIAIGIQSGDIVHVHGPKLPGLWPDINIFRDCLKHKLEFGVEKAEADDGYRGEPFFIELPNECGDGGDDQFNSKKAVRSRHETFNRRLKQWGALQQKYRHRCLNFHGDIFRSIVTLTQIEIRSGNPLFDVHYQTMLTDDDRDIYREIRIRRGLELN